MSTFVEGQRVRNIRSDTFADLADAAVWDIRWNGVLFGGELDEATVEAIRERLTTPEDVNLEALAVLAAARDAVIADPTLENVAALAVATANYRLGEAP